MIVFTNYIYSLLFIATMHSELYIFFIIGSVHAVIGYRLMYA